MRYLLLMLAAGLCSASSYAQNGFYLTASAGAGMSGAKRIYYNPNNAPGALKQSDIMNYHATMGVGYRYKHWRIETGLQYLTSGYQLNNLILGSDFDPNKTIITGTGNYRITYNHIGIPLQLGYAFPLSHKLNVVPSLGMLASYNLGAKHRLKVEDVAWNTNMPGDDFKKEYNTLSIWGDAGLKLEYKLSHKIGLFAGPSLQYMISSFYKKPTNNMVFTASQRNYSINMDLGLSVTL